MIHGHAICCYRSEAARKAVYRGLPMHLKKLGLAAVLLAVSTTVLAKQGEVCSSKPVLKDGTLTNDTVFECKTAGSLTIPQLYAQGWRVITFHSASSSPVVLLRISREIRALPMSCSSAASPRS